MNDILRHYNHHVKQSTLHRCEGLSSFLTAQQHILGYLVPYDGVKIQIKERGYNQGYLADREQYDTVTRRW